MKTRIALLLLLLSSGLTCSASDDAKVGTKIKCLKTFCDITLQVPRGFEASGKSEIYGVNFTMEKGKDKDIWKYGPPGYLYWIVASDKSGDCQLMYSDVRLTSSVVGLRDNDYDKDAARAFNTCWQGDMNAALRTFGGPHDDGVVYNPEKEKNITVMNAADAKESFNADSAYIIDFPIERAYKEKYNHCIGLYLLKTGHVPVFVKMMLTDKGYAQRQTYIDNLRKTIVFGKEKWKKSPSDIMHNGLL